MTSTNSASLPSVGLPVIAPGWSIAGVQLVNPDAGTPDFAPTVICQLRVDAGHGANLDNIAAGDVDKVKALPGAVIHGQRSVTSGETSVREVDIEASAGQGNLRQLMWFFAIDGHVYTAVASSQPETFTKLRPELEKGLKAVVSLMRGSGK